MVKGFFNFCSKQFTITVIISIIVYKILGILEEFLSSSLSLVLDKDDALSKLNVTYSGRTYNYGTGLRDILISFFVLVSIYYLAT